MSCHKQILEGRCFLSGEVQTFAQFPRYLVESQVFALYMFPLKSCKESQGTPDFPQQGSHLLHREVVWAANPPRTGVANLHPAPKTCLFLGSEAPVRRTNSDPERWGTPRLTRTDETVRRLTGDFFIHILYIYACRYVVAFVVSSFCLFFVFVSH